MRSLKVGDIVYIKAARPGQRIIVKDIGIIIDDQIRGVSNTSERLAVVEMSVGYQPYPSLFQRELVRIMSKAILFMRNSTL